MILNLAVPVAIALTLHSCLARVGEYVQADPVTEPATSASAAEEATRRAAPVQAFPLASTATPVTAAALSPTARSGVATEAVMVFAAFAKKVMDLVGKVTEGVETEIVATPTDPSA
jgi:hypothetical protein